MLSGMIVHGREFSLKISWSFYEISLKFYLFSDYIYNPLIFSHKFFPEFSTKFHWKFQNVWGALRLYKVIDNVNGVPLDPFELQEMANSRIYKEMLDDANCYIVDALSELFVWTGEFPAKIKIWNLNLVCDFLVDLK